MVAAVPYVRTRERISAYGLGRGCIGAFLGSNESMLRAGHKSALPPVSRAAGRMQLAGDVATNFDNSRFTQFRPGTVAAINGPFSLGALIFPTAFANYSAIFDNSDSATLNGYELRLGAASITDSDPCVILKNGSGFNLWNISGAGIVANKLTNLLYVSSGDIEQSGEMRVNNVSFTPTKVTTATGNIAPSSGVFSVGSRSDAVTKFTGGILLVAVWNRVLELTERDQFYRNPWQLFAPDPV